MQLTIDIPDETATLLQARGVELAACIEQAVAHEARAGSGPASKATSEAVDRIRERRNRLTLGGLAVRSLIDESRKY
jgi:hypothetical protein